MVVPSTNWKFGTDDARNGPALVEGRLKEPYSG